MCATRLSELSIALAQLNPTVGDLTGNLAKARAARSEAAARGAELVMFTELFLSGYPPEDLLLKPAFQAECKQALASLASDTGDGGPSVLIGLPYEEGGRLYNAYAHLAEGRIVNLCFKVDLPNYGVFDERRVFVPGPTPAPILHRGIEIGIPICEDIWGPSLLSCFRNTNVSVLLVPNASPYWRNKVRERLEIVAERVRDAGVPLVYLNQVGGQDELVFDGASFALKANGDLAASLPAFTDALEVLRLRRGDSGWDLVDGPHHPTLPDDEADYCACMLGLRDYVEKNGFNSVIVSFSGGVDSALCGAIAVDALGASRVHCVMFPFRYTSQASLEDAKTCASTLGVRYDIVPIAPAIEGLAATLSSVFPQGLSGIAAENIQSRARGTLMMTLSNALGSLVVTTGNKSELSVGYATLYGDMNGGFNPIKDVYKTEVYRLCALRNRWRPPSGKGPAGPVIPSRILTKPPSAELREGQTDQDSLPPYDLLDRILDALVERDRGVAGLIAEGYDADTVCKVARLLRLAEFKRRQAAPGPKVTSRNFGRDRRYPVTNAFREEDCR